MDINTKKRRRSSGIVVQWRCRSTDRLRPSVRDCAMILRMAEIHFCCQTAGRAFSFFFLHNNVSMSGALNELVEAYSSSNSSDDREESAQFKSSNLSECEDSFSDDVIAGDDEKASEKPKTELQLHNYFSSPLHFSSPARQPSAEEKVQIAKDSDFSHVMHPKGKLAVWVVPATEKDKARRKIYQQKRSDEAKIAEHLCISCWG